MTEIRPYGAWPSPVTPQSLVEGGTRVGALAPDGEAVVWDESRPAEAGRTQLVRREADGSTADLLAEGVSARSRVHSYGGGAWCVAGGVTWYVDDADQRIWRRDSSGDTRPLTPRPPASRSVRYADLVLAGDHLVAVRETHDATGATEPVNDLVSMPAHPGAVTELPEPVAPTVLAAGADFYAGPSVSPRRDRLAWIQWRHPDMPWDRTELAWARFDPATGTVAGVTVVAGDVGDGEAIVQPTFDPAGDLLAATDRTGWWNVHRFSDAGEVLATPKNRTPVEAEIGGPHWQFGEAWYAPLEDGSLVCSVTSGGLTGLARVPAGEAVVRPLEAGVTAVTQLRATGDAGAVLAVIASGTAGPHPVRLRLPAGGATTGVGLDVLAEPDVPLDPAWIAEPEPISFPSGPAGSRTAHALVYPPTNPEVRGPDGELPPLIVTIHGGPTGMARPTFHLRTQYWTTRGFAVVDVNYGGSTGFGRGYRRLLDGAWGVVDVEDCQAAARHLVAEGAVDGDHLAIRGSSAGGFTVLLALAVGDTFGAGASLYGISDLRALAAETHKFESRYFDRLIGPWPEAEATYLARSPLSHLEGFDRPLIVFQGGEDEVVPPTQAEAIVGALEDRGVEVRYHLFAEEGHGFRRAETLIAVQDAEETFYREVFALDA